MNDMTVSQLADRVSTTADTVRYYERIGLLPEPRRSASGYRLYEGADVDRLRFVKQAQTFGLALDDIRELVAVRDRGLCPCGHTRILLENRVAGIDDQISELTQLRDQIHGMLDALVERDAGTWPCDDRLIQIEDRRTRSTT